MDWTWEAGNGHHGVAIYNGAHNNRIGSTNVGEGNQILSNKWSGVVVVDGTENVIEGNQIGISKTDLQWSNQYFGIVLQGPGGGNQANFNEVAYNGTYMGQNNGQAGIKVDGSDSNMISRNSIYDNDGPGILLVNSGNNNIASPVISSASCEGPISGTNGGNSGWVQIFSDSSDEGRTWEGTTQANADGSWTWPGMVSGPNITATVRSSATNDTSAFSNPFYVGLCQNVSDLFLPLIIK
jgi:parallel beta-helix repeat protein